MTTDFSTDLSVMGDGPAGGGGLGPERTFDIKRFIRLRLLPMILIGLAIAVPGLAAVWMFVPVKYQASAQILYAVDTPGYIDSANTLNERQLQRFMTDQVNLVTGTTILSRVKADSEVADIPWVEESGNDLTPLREVIEARIIPGSNIMDITVSTDTREHALDIVTAVVSEYRVEASTRTRQETNAALDVLQKEKEEKERELERQRRELDVMIGTLTTPVSGEGMSRSPEMQSYYEGKAQAESDYSTTSRELERTKDELERLRKIEEEWKASPDEPLYARAIESQVLQNPAVVQYTSRLAELEAEESLLLQTYKPNAAPVQSIQKQIEAMTRSVATAKRTARQDLLASELSELEYQVKTLESRLADAENRRTRFAELIDENKQIEIDLQKDISKVEQQEFKLEDLRTEIQGLERDISQIVRDTRAPARIQSAGAPEAASAPSHNDRIKFSLLVLMAAFGCAAGYGILRELTDQSVRTPQDVTAITPLPLLASVPHSTDDRVIPGGSEVPLLTAQHPISTTADEMRRIMTRIIYPPEGSAELNTVLVTSPSRGDGKTSIACNLAVSLAQANRRVLLVDISSRYPSVERSFGFDPGIGLGEILVGEAEAGDLVRPTIYPNLMILGPGRRQRDLVGKLASRDIVEFLEGAEDAYEHVIIDTPPALLMSDAKLLAPIVDGVVVVCGVAVSSLGMMRRCLKDLQGIGANVIGVVLNGIRPQRGGYLAKNLQLYYQYSEGRDNGHGSGRDDSDLPDVHLAPGEEEAPNSEGDDLPMIMLADDSEGEAESSEPEDEAEVRS